MRKKLLFTMLAILGCISNVSAATNTDAILIPDVEIMQGKTANLVVNYDFDYDGTYHYRGFEFFVTLPDGFTSGEVTVGDDILAACPKMQAEYNVKDGETRVLLIQIAVVPMPTGTGTMMKMQIKASEDLEPGIYQCTTSYIELAEVDNESNESIALKIPNITFNLVVKEYQARELSEEDADIAEATEEGLVEDVIVKRKIAPDTWSTLCLPFGMDEGLIEENFGENAQIAQFKDFTLTTNTRTVNGEEKIDSTCVVNFESINKVEGIQKNTPYVIKISGEERPDGIEEITAYNVSIEPDEGNAFVLYQTGSGNKIETLASMSGTLCKKTLPNNVLFLSGNKLFISKNTTMKGFRGYLELYDICEASQANLAIMLDNETTDIEGLTINGKEIQNGKVYTVSGVYMGRAEDLQGKLPRGMYIVNNKKFIVK